MAGIQGADPRPTRRLDPEPQILVVEDDVDMRHLITRLLRDSGFRAIGAGDGDEMRETLANTRVDLVLLDVMLPGQSGLVLCRELRARSCIPIIMLTARGEEADRVAGFKVGADDYIPKPFGRQELPARIRAVLRRASVPPESEGPSMGRYVRFAGWVLDTARHELVSPAGVTVDLSGAEYDLLIAFLEHPHRVLSRERILELARNRIGDRFDRSVDVLVSRLRRKLEPTVSHMAVIKTVRGAGYLFVPAVEHQ